MRLNHLYMDKPLRTSAVALHDLYQASLINVPSVEDILVKLISLSKYFNESLSGLDEFEVNEDEIAEYKALCDFLNIDYDEIAPMDYGDNNG